MRYRNAAHALLFVLAIAAGAVYLWASSRPPHEGSPEAGFARDMMVHHAQAVQMAEIVRDFPRVVGRPRCDGGADLLGCQAVH